ncbi:MAG: hypothetical protein WBI41_07725 [Azovibrio sp.]|uniref:hypothetical protein n=1 Tax=Azovibrio sp. TaxID=1872673 RepID=UPI003C754AA4
MALHDKQLSDVFAEHHIDAERIWSMVRGECPVAANLISSDFDADRIDYLLRTSHHSGVPYGAIDIDYLLTQLRVRGDRICITPKAVGAMDHFLLSRFFDYQQIAFSKAVVGFERCLQALIAEMLAAGQLDLSPTWVRNEIASGTWALRDESWLSAEMREFALESKDPYIKRMGEAVLQRRQLPLIGECVVVANDTSHFAEHQHYTQRALSTIAAGAGLDPKSLLMWSTSVRITKVGASIPVSDIMEGSGSDGIAQLVPVLYEDEDGSQERIVPIVDVDSSLMKLVADASYQAIRVFALVDERDRPLRQKLQKLAKQELLFFNNCA